MKKFTMLTVLDEKVKNNRIYFYCRCECGSKKWIRADSVKNGKTTNCGCVPGLVNDELKFKHNYKEEWNAIEIYDNVLHHNKKFPNKFWSNSKSQFYSIQIVKHLIEDILNWDEEEIKNNLCANTFREYKLYSMMNYVYDGSPFHALNSTYPNKFKIWELIKSPHSIWKDNSTRNDAIVWLLQKTNKASYEELTSQDFINYNINGILKYIKVHELNYKSLNNIDVNVIEKVIFKHRRGNEKELIKDNTYTVLQIPKSWLMMLGVSKEDSIVTIKFDKKRNNIIIEKK